MIKRILGVLLLVFTPIILVLWIASLVAFSVPFLVIAQLIKGIGEGLEQGSITITQGMKDYISIVNVAWILIKTGDTK